MAATLNLPSLYADIARHGKHGEWQKALKLSNKVLQISPDDKTAFECKVVCLIHLSQFQEAIDLFKNNDKLSGDLQFEKAYCYYRFNNTHDALEILNAVEDPSLKIKELKAQVLYRLERYEECYQSYKEVMKNTQDDYEDERETNISAVIANLHINNSPLVTHVATIRENTYELVYNAACSLVSQGQYQLAIEKLQKAEEMCKKTLEDEDIPENETDEELGIIRVQQAYALQMLGRSTEAAVLYANVLKSRPSDASLVAVASNNVIVINKDQNVFDSKKKIKLATASGLEHKLTKKQRDAISLNHCLLLMYTNQRKQFDELLNQLKVQQLDNPNIALIEAAQLSRERNTSKAVEVLESYSRSHEENSVNISFTLVQLLLMQGQISQACNVLRSLGDASFKPAVVSALVSLYSSLDNPELVCEIFNESIAWYKKNDPQNENYVTLLRESANFYLNRGNAQSAADCLEELHRLCPKDMKVLAQLVTAYSQFDAKKALLTSKSLPAEDDSNMRSVDVDALELSAWAMGLKYLKKSTTKTDSSAAGDQLKKKRKKKKKKGKLPKNYNPNVRPNPDRWLPRKDRANVKKRKDKDRRNKDANIPTVGKGTQGGTVGSADLDMSTKPHANAMTNSPRANNDTVSPGTSTKVPTSLTQKPRHSQAMKMKKKKGGKY